MKHIMWELGFRSYDLARLPAPVQALLLVAIDRMIAVQSAPTAAEPRPRKGLAKVIPLFPAAGGVRP